MPIQQMFLGLGAAKEMVRYIWGSNEHPYSGMLGQNQARTQLGDASSPMQVGTGTDWRSLHNAGGAGPGGGGMIASKTDNSLWFCGAGTRGTSGQNSLVDYSSPVQVPGDWMQYAGGGAAVTVFKLL